jgi:CelD/BcsL family acetyltransferase involved in cellulose biosynthesis
MMKWTYQWALSWEQIWKNKYVRSWLELLDVSQTGSSPFFHPMVVRAWLASVGGPTRIKPFFLTASCSDGAAAFLPLGRTVKLWKPGKIRRLLPVGDMLFDYHDPIFSAQVECGSAVERAFWDGLELELQRHAGDWFDDFVLPRVRGSIGRDSPRWRLSEKAPYTKLYRYESFGDFFVTRNKSLRNDVKRQMKRLSAEGKISLRVYDAHDLDEAIAWLPRLEAMKKRKYPDSIIRQRYLGQLLRWAVHDGPVHCSALLVGNRDISWHVGFCHKGTFYWYVPTYHPDYSGYSPGKIHIYSAMEWAFNSGCHTFDFLRGGETYKYGWTDADEFQMHEMLLESRKTVSIIRRKVARGVSKLSKTAAKIVNKLKRVKPMFNAS